MTDTTVLVGTAGDYVLVDIQPGALLLEPKVALVVADDLRRAASLLELRSDTDPAHVE